MTHEKMIRQKPLLPSLKEKKRYFAYKIHAEKALPRNAGNLLVKEVQRILGVFDSAAAGLQSITFDANTNKGVIRTSLKLAKKVRIAMLLLTKIHDEPIMVQPLLTSGILRRTKTRITG